MDNKKYTQESLENNPWEKLFAPVSMSQVVLPERISSVLSKGIQRDYLFYGTPGTGKSTVAKVATSNMNVLYVNASRNGKIENLREGLTEFAASASISFDDTVNDSQKVIFLDEMDGVSDSFADGLRGFMDEYPTVRYIGTCNYFNKIKPAIKSRFTPINFNYQSDEELKEIRNKYAKRIFGIIKITGIKFNKETLKPTLLYLINEHFPDFRDILQTLQTLYLTGLPFEVESFSKIVKGSNGFFDLIFDPNTTPELLHQEVMAKYQNNPEGMLEMMGKNIYDYVAKYHPFKLNVLSKMIIVIAEYQANAPLVIDPLVNLKACAYSIRQICAATT